MRDFKDSESLALKRDEGRGLRGEVDVVVENRDMRGDARGLRRVVGGVEPDQCPAYAPGCWSGPTLPQRRRPRDA
jgi:hypothetical protein